MVQISGIYSEGHITFDQNISTDKPVKVLVTFIDEESVRVAQTNPISSFSFTKCRELLQDVKVDFSTSVIDERRSEL